MGWRLRAQEHAYRDHRQAQQGNQRWSRRSQTQGAVCRPRRGSVPQFTRRVRQIHRRRNREGGQGGRGGQYQSGVRPPVPRTPRAGDRTGSGIARKREKLKSTAFTTGLPALGPVSRVTPVHTAMRNCTRDEGRPFGFGDQVASLTRPQAAVVKSDGGERCGNVGTMISAGKIERGERKQTASEASKAD